MVRPDVQPAGFRPTMNTPYARWGLAGGAPEARRDRFSARSDADDADAPTRIAPDPLTPGADRAPGVEPAPTTHRAPGVEPAPTADRASGDGDDNHPGPR